MMVRWKNFIVYIAFMAVLLGYAGPAAAASTGEKALTSWQLTAFRYFRDDKYKESLKVLEAHRGDKFTKVLITFVHLQEWVYSKGKPQEVLWKGEFKALVPAVGIQEIPYLALIAEERDKPQAQKYAIKLLKRCFENIYSNNDVPVLVDYIGSEDADVSKLALKTLNRILKTRRKVVQNGGSLRAEDVRMMRDKGLVSQLVAIVSQEPIAGRNPTSVKSISEATKALVFIEEPTLEMLEKVDGMYVSKAKTKVQKAIAKRRTKFPKSNWFSAIGKDVAG